MLDLTNEQVLITTDDLIQIYATQQNNGKCSLMLRFKGNDNEYAQQNWSQWQGTIRKNSSEPSEEDRVVVSENSFVFPTGTFKNPLKAQIGINAIFDNINKTINQNGVTIRIYFDNKQNFDFVWSQIIQMQYFSQFDLSFMSEDLIWKKVNYLRK